MISFVSGRVAAVAPDAAVIEVGGVGMAVLCTPGTLARLRVGEPARLATSLIVREDSLTLYGFADDDERTCFELLQTASGVGPKVALAALAVHTPNALRVAVAAGDVKALTQVPGIGPKGAQRMIVELKDRLGAPHAADELIAEGAPEPAWREQVHAGLVNLGYSGRDADEAIAAVAAEADALLADGGVAALLKTALRRLSVR